MGHQTQLAQIIDGLKNRIGSGPIRAPPDQCQAI
jgi:hypothetical protein